MKLPLVLLLSGAVVAGVPVSNLVAASQETAQAKGGAAGAAANQSPPSPPSWPRQITSDGVTLAIYQPQVDAWENSRLLKARAAFVMTPGKGKPVIGVMELEGPTTTDLQKRTVLIREPKITAVRFPSLPEAEVPPTEELFRKTFPSRSLTVSLDRLVAGVEHSAKPLTLKMEPPRVLTSEQPALLLLIEGKPVLAPAGKGKFVVNANWDVFSEGEGAAYYLFGGGLWYTAKALDGDWELAATLPAFLSALPEGSQWEHVKKAIPPKVERGQKIAKVVFSGVPTELIVFDGSPVWEEISGIDLSWARNTESRVFRSGNSVYFLTSGRWFSAPDLSGPWQYASNDLPEAFSKIPHDSPCADVLASVPGTPEAADAIVLASIPREAVVKVAEAEAKASATYNGEPEFKSIEGTKMAYATNTSSDVIRVEKKYYLCQSGVWFVSTSPKGPWKICTTVPAVVYTIPPSCPVHRVVYVTVEPGSSPDVVVCSYTSGYEGAYIAGTGAGAVLVWGTGYYYPPYVAWGAVPVYYPYPATYGAAAVYNPWNGGYAVGQRYYGPYGSAGSAAWYNPNTGNYGRAARVSTPYGSSTYAAGYNPRTDTGWATQQNYNGYTQWGTSAVQRGDDWIRTGHAVNENGAVAGWQGSEGGGHVWKTDDHSGGTAHHDGDFYAGRDGNVYKRDEDGDWAKYDDGDWESVDAPERDSKSSSAQSEAPKSENVSSESPSSREDAAKNRESTRESNQETATTTQGERKTEKEGTTREERQQQATESQTGERRQNAENSENRQNAENRRAETQTGEGTRSERAETRKSSEARTSSEGTRSQRRETSGQSRTASRERTGDISHQLNRDASNRRSGAAREQRNFERRSSGAGGGGRATRERRR